MKKIFIFLILAAFPIYAQQPVILESWMQVEGDHLSKDENLSMPKSNKTIVKLDMNYLKNSIDTIPVKYLDLGNKYLFRTSGHAHGGYEWDYTYISEVMSDTYLFNNKIFHRVTNASWQFSDTTQLIFLDGGEEIIVCDFSWNVGDTIFLNQYKYIPEEKGFGIIFNEMQLYMKLKRYRNNTPEYYEQTIFKKFGIVDQYYNAIFIWHYLELLGAEINGIIYGYPPVHIQDDNEIVRDFELYQNYPNPFNPTTNIKFEIPNLSFVSLKVYDALGIEIATLIYEEILSGIYFVEFNADEYHLSSGIYFYTLTSGNFTATKKLILLK